MGFVTGEHKFLTTEDPVVPTFYAPEDATGRPIAPGLGSLGENLCPYVGFLLQPLELKLPSVPSDLRDFLSPIQQPENRDPMGGFGSNR